MERIVKVFLVNKLSLDTCLQDPTEEQFLDYVEKLESWDWIFVSTATGEVFHLRDYILNMVE
jgi:hypothetical protein